MGKSQDFAIKNVMSVLRIALSNKISYRPYNNNNKYLISDTICYIAFTGVLITSVAFEVCSILIMNILGSFYKSISSGNKREYQEYVRDAIIIVILTAVTKSSSIILSELSSLILRERLVYKLQEKYMCESVSIMYQYDNIDQRITQDVQIFAMKLIEIVAKLICVPAVIVYYTWLLCTSFEWFLPFVCYCYFVIGYLLNHMLMKRIVPLIYTQERYEGNFRYAHVTLRDSMEAVSLLLAEESELHNLTRQFSVLVRNQYKIIVAHIPLYLASNMFSYLGSIGKVD